MKIRIKKTNRKVPVSPHIVFAQPYYIVDREDWTKFENRVNHKSWWYRLWNRKVK